MEDMKKTEKTERKTKDGQDGFTAMGDDIICSTRLNPGTYSAYRSPEGNWLRIEPDEDGDIACDGGSVAIEGLDCLIAGGFPCVLSYAVKDGGFLIKLDQ